MTAGAISTALRVPAVRRARCRERAIAPRVTTTRWLRGASRVQPPNSLHAAGRKKHRHLGFFIKFRIQIRSVETPARKRRAKRITNDHRLPAQVRQRQIIRLDQVLT